MRFIVMGMATNETEASVSPKPEAIAKVKFQ